MRKIFKLMALIAIFVPMMTSCSGGSDSESMLFGKVPSVYKKFMAEEAKLKEESKNIKTEQEKAEYLKKTDKLKEEWKVKIEDAAKTVDGKTIELAESNIKVTEPLTMNFDGLKPNGLYPVYKLSGHAEASENIPVNTGKFVQRANVSLVGYNKEGQQIFSTKVGTIQVNVDNEPTVMAGTPVTFNNLSFNDSDIEKYDEISSLKLEIL